MPFSRDHARSPYNEGSCQTYYDYNSGLMPLTVGGDGDGDSTLLVRVARATSSRSVIFSLSRQGDFPSIPSAKPLDSNEVLLTARVSIAWPILLPDSETNVYKVDGSYVFAHRKALVPGRDILPVGTGPYDAANPNTCTLRPDHFDKRPIPPPSRQSGIDPNQNIIG
jgi:hypothetical protein